MYRGRFRDVPAKAFDGQVVLEVVARVARSKQIVVSFGGRVTGSKWNQMLQAHGVCVVDEVRIGPAPMRMIWEDARKGGRKLPENLD